MLHTSLRGENAPMGFLRRTARLLLAAIFVHSGIDVLRKPEGRAQAAGDALATIKRIAPSLPDDDVTLVRANAAVQLVAGSMLASDRLPRLSAFALAGSLVPTTIGGHPFWKATDPSQRAQQRIHFEKNVAILGGLLLAVAGPPATTTKARGERGAARPAPSGGTAPGVRHRPAPPPRG
jgi:uncharacterized membrane protein YphA (DoxX/SURF4 family)